MLLRELNSHPPDIRLVLGIENGYSLKDDFLDSVIIRRELNWLSGHAWLSEK
jgi:hypothetical protein